MNRPEEALQRQVAAFLDVALPEDAVWWHTPNQRGTRARFENEILKALGVKGGFPDVAILFRGRLYCIELKAPGRKPTDAQDALRARLQRAGAIYPDEPAYRLEEVEGYLDAWFIPLKARAA